MLHPTPAALAALCLMTASVSPALAHPLVDELEARCTPLLTVQKGMCEVERFFRCGDQGYAILSAEDGQLGGVEFSGPNGQLGDFISLQGPGSVIVESTEDPLDFASLRENGSEQSSYSAVLDIGESVALRIELSLALSNTVVTRNGLNFRTGSAGMEMSTGASIGGFSRIWEILVSEDENIVITGKSTMIRDDGSEDFATDIRDILIPGDDGFGSSEGRYDCGEEL